MGLDMYLSAKRYVWFNEADAISQDIAHHFPEIGDKKVKEIIVEAAYWRKANAIHKWFVDNVQEGVDDCGNYEVSREQLQELLTLIETALTDRENAGKMLPTASGFFFGSTDYDDWYFEDLANTVEMLKPLLDPKWEKWDFEYHSSW